MCHSSYRSLGSLLGPLQLFASLVLYAVEFLKYIFYYLCVQGAGEVCVFVYVYICRYVCFHARVPGAHVHM